MERECFETFLRELAFFHVPSPLLSISDNPEDQTPEEKSERWQIQHIVFPQVSACAEKLTGTITLPLWVAAILDTGYHV